MWGTGSSFLPAHSESNTVDNRTPRQLPRFTTRGVTKSAVVSQHSTGDFVDAYYDRVRAIGKGTFGRVELVRERKSGSERVCKEVNTSGKPPAVKDLTRQEIEVLASLDHPNIVRLYEFSEDLKQNQFILILEFMDGGDCKGLLLKSHGGLQEKICGQLICQTLVALAYCHGYGVIHRDVKPENMLLGKTGLWGDRVCKLVDFGLAAKQNASKEFFGTFSYAAPEVVARKYYSPKCDIWALGVTCIELLTHQLPFGRLKDYNGDAKPIFQRISAFRTLADLGPQVKSSPGWTNRSQASEDFLVRVLKADCSERMHAQEALQLPWPQSHKTVPAGLTSQMLRSFANYNEAPPPIRCCLLAIAVRANVPDQERLGTAFLAADVDSDGRISSEDLQIAVENASYWWDADVDVHDLVKNANLDHSGGLSYSEFVAACQYEAFGSLDELISRAFSALDDDRDGYVRVQDIRAIFRERDIQMLQNLPQDRPFTVKEWCQCVGSTCADFSRRQPQHRHDNLLGNAMMCVQTPRTASLDGGEQVIEQGERPVRSRRPPSSESEDGICDGIMPSRSRCADEHQDEQPSSLLATILRRIWPSG